MIGVITIENRAKPMINSFGILNGALVKKRNKNNMSQCKVGLTYTITTNTEQYDQISILFVWLNENECLYVFVRRK